jgi:hypothetical protein
MACNVGLVTIVIFSLGDSATTMLLLSVSILLFVVVQLALAFVFVVVHKLRMAWQAVSLCCWMVVLRRPRRDFYVPAMKPAIKPAMKPATVEPASARV